MQSRALPVDHNAIRLADTWPAAFIIALWLGAMAWGIGFIVRFI
jgi:hypothetical protein